ncbi:hypothetical protein LTR36_008960 [Oleoguttula mirabilis]|uniref:Major facilitator superfamily (MFS) profile domain-containing protein n=1 Tax=Oleoguttula mirabilis TaxID=1507867 RepID=A0AAV9J7Q0_9PEZI|nr:hypothetical protein LTR36_008960 [Oleoguttula mirabilis]
MLGEQDEDSRRGRRPAVGEEPDETTSLLPQASESRLCKTLSRVREQESLPVDNADAELAKDDKAKDPGTSTDVYATISVLLLGVFISQTDQSLVLATYGKIASDFDDFSSGSWLMSAYMLAQCVAQPLYGKLSDIYGRKSCLQASYALFAIGTAGSGFGQSMGAVIAARAIQGAGGAGMVSMVSIIITDLVPMHEVASLRSYVNVLQTTGRSCGGVIGGFLTQTLGWRWAFLIQVPPILVAIVLVQVKLHLTPNPNDVRRSKWEKLKRIDFIGAFFLCSTILSMCFILDTGGQKLPWNSPAIKILGAVGIVSAAAYAISARFVPEPIFPLRLLAHYTLVTNYLIIILQVTVQISLIMSVPIFFQATVRASTAAAGAYLIPAFAGNTLGGLMTGYWIKKTGLFKAPTVVAPVLAVLGMLLCLLTWDEHTSVLKSLAIFPGGFATGMVASSTFVGLAAGVDEKDIAMAASGMYLFYNLGSIAGVSGGSAVFEASLKSSLAKVLEGRSDMEEVMRRALGDLSFVRDASDELRHLLVPAYVYSFHRVNRKRLLLYLF